MSTDGTVGIEDGRGALGRGGTREAASPATVEGRQRARRWTGEGRARARHAARAARDAFTDLEHVLGKLREATARGGRELTLRDLGSGQWLTKLTRAYLEVHAERRARDGDARARAEARTLAEGVEARADSVVQRTALGCALGGAGAAGLISGAILATAEGGGLTGLVALPAALAALGTDVVLRSLLHLHMTTELANLHGLELGPEDAQEVLRLLAVALGHVQHEVADDPGRALVKRLSGLGMPDVGQLLGVRVLSESLLRDALPVVAVVASSAINYTLTRRVAATVRAYLRLRRPLEEAYRELEARASEMLPRFVEGVWFVLTADARLSAYEAAVLTHLVEQRAAHLRPDLLERLEPDATRWLERLRGLADGANAQALVHALERAVQATAEVDPGGWEAAERLLGRARAALAATRG